jgi:site-specific DNA-cytosine methylase
MKVLVACEFSGRVRQAFRDRGHDAVSWDLLPAEDGSVHHIQGPIKFALLYSAEKWDLMIAHPPCTYLTNAGARWWPGREQEQAEALAFVRALMDAPIHRVAIENPPGRIGSQIRKADQYIHPWQFGHMETKTTGLWLKNLPLLRPTHIVKDEMDKLPCKQKNRIHWMSPSKDRAKERSRTYQGIADAMAEQWGVERKEGQP